MFRAVLVVCFAIGFVAHAGADDQDLAAAKKAYTDAAEKAREALLDAFATAIKSASASGSLEVVKALQAEKEAFEVTGKLPISARMKGVAVTYQLAMKQANTNFETAYERIIKELTKAGKVAQAEAAQAELKEFRAKAQGAALRPGDVATKEDLAKYVAGTSWTWGDGLKLRADGLTEQRVWDAQGLVTRWEAIDRRTVILTLEKGRDTDRLAVMTFSEDLSECRAINFEGKRATLKRKP